MFLNNKTGSAAIYGIQPTNQTQGQGDSNGDKNNVPEPASLALMGLGLLGIASLRKRNKP